MTRNRGLQGSIRTAKATSPRKTFTVVLVVLTIILPLEASNANYRVCFTQVVGLPVLTNPPPVDGCGRTLVANQPPFIDGCVIGNNPDGRAGDPGWTEAFRYVWGNGVNSSTMAPLPPNAAVQGIRDNTFLYLSIEVNNDTSFDDNDLVILTFSPTNGASATDDRRIHIYPNSTGVQKPVGSAPRLVEYWTDSSHWDNVPCTGPNQPAGCDPLASGPKTLPNNVSIAVSNRIVAGKSSWFVEAAIPLAAFDIPANGRFGFYVNVLRVVNGGFVNQFYWPPASATGGNNGVQLPVDQHTPAPANWGEATQDPTLVATCKGVSLAWSDITSNHPPDQIDATCLPGPGPNCATQSNSNTFSATLQNNSVGIDPITHNPIPVSAQGILATFSVANFGLPSNWTPVPVGTPPGRTGPIDINPNATATLTTSPPWVITDPNLIANYKANPDQCILVDLDSTAPSCVGSPNNCVAILNKSVKRNMWVLTASEVSKKAEISAKGYGPAPAGRSQQEFELRVSSHQEVLKPGETPMSRQVTGQPPGGYATRKNGRIVSRLTWAVSGCRLTGQYVTIKGTTYEICDDVGAFGAVVEHFGLAAVEKWLTGLEGPGLTRDPNDKDMYRLRVPQEGVADVTVKFQPEEQANGGKFALFLDAGATIPQGSFGSAFNKGFSFNAGLEYIAHPHFSVEGIFGYHHFPGTITSALNIYQFSVNGKTYLTNGPIRPFVNGGVGGYKFGSGSTYFGGNVGAGLLYSITSRVGVQGSYNFHAIKTPVTTEFSAVEAGFRFEF